MVELRELSVAFKTQMMTTYVGKQPFYGQLASKVDPRGDLQDAMWRAVAESRPIFGAMLSGARWGDDRPADLDKRISRAKNRIRERLNGTARRPLLRKHADPDLEEPYIGSNDGGDDRPRKRVTLRSSKAEGQSTDIDEAESSKAQSADRHRKSVTVSPLSSITTFSAEDPFVDKPRSPVRGSVMRPITFSSTPAGSRRSRSSRGAVFTMPIPNLRSPTEHHVLKRQSSGPARQGLSARIQEVVARETESLARRVAELEKRAMLRSDQEQDDGMVRVTSMPEMRMKLADRESTIKKLRAELDAVRSRGP